MLALALVIVPRLWWFDDLDADLRPEQHRGYSRKLASSRHEDAALRDHQANILAHMPSALRSSRTLEPGVRQEVAGASDRPGLHVVETPSWTGGGGVIEIRMRPMPKGGTHRRRR